MSVQRLHPNPRARDPPGLLLRPEPERRALGDLAPVLQTGPHPVAGPERVGRLRSEGRFQTVTGPPPGRKVIRRGRRPRGSAARQGLDWLLEPDQPSIRYLTLTQLLGKKDTASDVREAKARIPTTGWVAEILSRRDPAGWWVRPRGWLEPRFLGTNWNMLALSDLGASRETPEVRASSEFWMASAPLRGGGVGGFGKGKGHHCYTANMARALIRLGYGDDPRVRKTLEWLVRTAHPKGGWTCRFSTDGPATSRTLDAWEGLSAFAAYPRSKWTPARKDCVERGAEFFLDRELNRQGERYDPWYRFHR